MQAARGTARLAWRRVASQRAHAWNSSFTRNLPPAECSGGSSAWCAQLAEGGRCLRCMTLAERAGGEDRIRAAGPERWLPLGSVRAAIVTSGGAMCVVTQSEARGPHQCAGPVARASLAPRGTGIVRRPSGVGRAPIAVLASGSKLRERLKLERETRCLTAQWTAWGARSREECAAWCARPTLAQRCPE